MQTINPLKSIGIIGYGWLGKALADHLLLINQGKRPLNICATTTNINKLNTLQNSPITGELLSLPSSCSALLKHNIFKQEQVIICIPPQFKQGKRDYHKNIKAIVEVAEQKQVKQLILISTTAIYRGLTGNISEQCTVNLQDEKVQCLYKAEQAVVNFSGYSAVIRFAGLVDEQRHPGRFLAGKHNLTAANARVNLIHQRDAVACIMALLNTPQQQGIYNGLSATNATRKAFYQLAATKLGLVPPSFIDEKNESITTNKIISHKKIQDKLAVRFTYPDLFTWLQELEQQ